MKVLVDTSIWSLALRRPKSHDHSLINELESLISDFRVQMIGPIRQELLSGIKSNTQFEKLKSNLQAFPDQNLHSADFELAADFYNQCRRKGVQGSNTDFLICAVAVIYKWQIFTTDNDFFNYRKILPIQLYQLS